MLNILGKRYYFFALSLVIILAGLLVLVVMGLPLSVDFAGGTILEVQFKSGTAPLPGDITTLYKDLGAASDAIAQPTSSTSGVQDILLIRSSALSSDQLEQVKSALIEKYGEIIVRKSDTVGPTISQQVTSRAGLAIGLAGLAVVIYITFAFRGIANAFRYGVCAIIAMLHDILIVASLGIIGANFFGWQIDSLFLTALLTVIGFSVQDKIVVFDRVRENSNILRKLDFEKLVNHSIVQTLQRSINTQLMTVEFMLLAIALFGGVTLREFAVILLVGLFSGTYSSIFIAAPILVVWEKKEWRTWFKGNKTAAA